MHDIATIVVAPSGIATMLPDGLTPEGVQDAYHRGVLSLSPPFLTCQRPSVSKSTASASASAAWPGGQQPHRQPSPPPPLWSAPHKEPHINLTVAKPPRMRRKGVIMRFNVTNGQLYTS